MFSTAFCSFSCTKVEKRLSFPEGNADIMYHRGFLWIQTEVFCGSHHVHSPSVTGTTTAASCNRCTKILPSCLVFMSSLSKLGR